MVLGSSQNGIFCSLRGRTFPRRDLDQTVVEVPNWRGSRTWRGRIWRGRRSPAAGKSSPAGLLARLRLTSQRRRWSLRRGRRSPHTRARHCGATGKVREFYGGLYRMCVGRSEQVGQCSRCQPRSQIRIGGCRLCRLMSRSEGLGVDVKSLSRGMKLIGRNP